MITKKLVNVQSVENQSISPAREDPAAASVEDSNNGRCCTGSWIECINPFSNAVGHSFFRHVPGCKKYAPNDSSKICPVCWSQAQRNNERLYGRVSPPVQTLAQLHHLGSNKPGKDTL